ncbi:virion morphogenesis protein [Acinetobacter terrestris]|uniref:phage virion morphogenesis protein n=1 Tax=Acinetobacter terrestris TaxID=2529843 RepID=UPI00103B45D0|nr:phage virion morphogenesis protein [Acinetobacter terrestris]TCB48394.1 virion morphogenesis protein [Acinetobacter terrestris]
MADSIQFHGQKKITEWLNKVLKQAGDHSKLMHNIGSVLEHNTKQRINTGIGTDDKPWQKSWRAKLQGGTTLRDTSRLYNSIKYTVLDGGKRVVVGTNVFYAPVLHFGATIRAKTGKYLKFKTTMGGWAQIQSVIIPPRPFLGMSVDDSQEVLFEIEEYLLELLLNAK